MKTIRDIEAEFDVSRIKANGLSIWPALRMEIFYRIEHRLNFSVKLSARVKTLLSFIYSLTFVLNTFRPCDILFCSQSIDLKPFGENWYNRFYFSIYNAFSGQSLGSMILPRGNLFNIGRPSDPYFFYSGPLYLAARVMTPFIPLKFEGGDELNRIFKSCSVSFDYEGHLKRYFAYKRVFKFLLKRKRPRLIFILDSYSTSHMALIQAAKELRIRVIEVQHGVVNTHHPAYQDYGGNLDPSFFPDYFVCYSETVKQDLKKLFWANGDRILPLGDPYLSYLARREQGQKRVMPTVLVTLQEINEKEVISFVEEVAKGAPAFQFVLLPRFKEKFTAPEALPQNVSVEMIKDFYTLIQECHIHLTAFSSCALEAPVFGVPNILYDLDGFATRYYGKFLQAELGTYYILTADQFKAVADLCMAQDPGTLKDKIHCLVGSRFSENLHVLTGIERTISLQ